MAVPKLTWVHTGKLQGLGAHWELWMLAQGGYDAFAGHYAVPQLLMAQLIWGWIKR
jgi:hypothetical protein